MTNIWLFLAIVFAIGGLVGGSSCSARSADKDEDDADEQYAQQVSADQCDSYWDPPGDDI